MSLSLTQRDHPQITRCLTPLNNKELINVGLRLGLRYPTLQKMSPESLLNDMVHAWLRRDDDVAEETNWESLATALQSCGYNGIASEILEDNDLVRKISARDDGVSEIMDEHISYHEAIRGSQAEERLKLCTSHGYLTRYSEISKCYKLTVYQKEPNNVIKHFQISFRSSPNNKEMKLYRIEGKDEEFVGLEAVLAHYEKKRIDPALRRIGQCVTAEQYFDRRKQGKDEEFDRLEAIKPNLEVNLGAECTTSEETNEQQRQRHLQECEELKKGELLEASNCCIIL